MTLHFGLLTRMDTESGSLCERLKAEESPVHSSVLPCTSNPTVMIANPSEIVTHNAGNITHSREVGRIRIIASSKCPILGMKSRIKIRRRLRETPDQSKSARCSSNRFIHTHGVGVAVAVAVAVGVGVGLGIGVGAGLMSPSCLYGHNLAI
jgi:hypothetical protein